MNYGSKLKGNYDLPDNFRKVLFCPLPTVELPRKCYPTHKKLLLFSLYLVSDSGIKRKNKI